MYLEVLVTMTNDTQGLELGDLRTDLIIQRGLVRGSFHQQGPWEASISFRSPAPGKMGSKDREGCQGGQIAETAQQGPRAGGSIPPPPAAHNRELPPPWPQSDS